MNLHKSKVFGIGVTPNEILNCARILGCDSATLPFTYLGVPVGANMTLKKNWSPVLDKVNQKLSVWKAKTLSFGGRLTLVKSVLGSLPIFYFSLFKAPCSVIEMLERSRRRFLWGGSEEKKQNLLGCLEGGYGSKRQGGAWYRFA